MEVESGRVLYEKNPHEKLPMASTTKIMTAILVIGKHSPRMLLRSLPCLGIEGSSLYRCR